MTRSDTTRRWRTAIGATLLVAALPLLGHAWVALFTPVAPPTNDELGRLESQQVTRDGPIRRFGESFAIERYVDSSDQVKHAGIHLVVLRGDSFTLGYAHAKLMYDAMVRTEQAMWDRLDSLLPSKLLQLGVIDYARFRYRNLSSAYASERLLEIAGQAKAFTPDPYETRIPTFTRYLQLNAVYDIALSFEHTPLIGCTTLVSAAGKGEDVWMARNFDFEAHPIFDLEKTLFVVSETNKIPFVSVAWAGLPGVVSGVNRHGLAVVVHGARAGRMETSGEPVVHELRRLLQTASTVAEAFERLKEHTPLVSHILVLADRGGHLAKVEVVPGQKPFLLDLKVRGAVTNHLSGPAKADPRNLRVESETTTVARLARASALVEPAAPHAVLDTAAEWVAALRDRNSAQGEALPLGDRAAIDAQIATHGIVLNLSRLELWVSTSPNLLGKFVRFDLKTLLDPKLTAPGERDPTADVAADPLLHSEEYLRFQTK